MIDLRSLERHFFQLQHRSSLNGAHGYLHVVVWRPFAAKMIQGSVISCVLMASSIALLRCRSP